MAHIIQRLGASTRDVLGKNVWIKSLKCASEGGGIPCRGMAGHSKWSNIRHIKASKDAERQKVTQKYIRIIKAAIKEGGSTNPKFNSSLAKAIESARSSNLPQATINNVLETYQKSQENAKSAILEYKGPGGLFILAELLTDNLSRTKMTLQGVLKKLNIQETRGIASHIFEEKGIVIAAQKGTTLEAALDSAIETGAEEVVEEAENLVFTSSPEDFVQVKQGLEGLGYEITYASVDYFPRSHVTIPEEEAQQLAMVIQKMEDHDDVIKIHVNVS